MLGPRNVQYAPKTPLIKGVIRRAAKNVTFCGGVGISKHTLHIFTVVKTTLRVYALGFSGLLFTGGLPWHNALMHLSDAL